MLVIQRQGIVGVDQTEHGLVKAGHGKLVAIVTADKLNLIDTHFCMRTEEREQQGQQNRLGRCFHLLGLAEIFFRKLVSPVPLGVEVALVPLTHTKDMLFAGHLRQALGGKVF